MQNPHHCADVRGLTLRADTPIQHLEDLQGRFDGELNIVNAHGQPFVYADDAGHQEILSTIGQAVGAEEQVRDLLRI